MHVTQSDTCNVSNILILQVFSMNFSLQTCHYKIKCIMEVDKVLNANRERIAYPSPMATQQKKRDRMTGISGAVFVGPVVRRSWRKLQLMMSHLEATCRTRARRQRCPSYLTSARRENEIQSWTQKKSCNCKESGINRTSHMKSPRPERNLPPKRAHS